MSWIEATATLFGFLCVWFTIRQNILCWPTGLVQVFLYIFVFYDSKLYADMALHVIYVALNIYGWIHWHTSRDENPVSQTNHLRLWLMTVILGTLLSGYLLSKHTDAAAPYIDSCIVMGSLVAQWLMARKKLESWFFWIFIDVLAIGLYSYKGLHLTSGLYTAFLLLAIFGYFQWKRDLHAERKYTTN